MGFVSETLDTAHDLPLAKVGDDHVPILEWGQGELRMVVVMKTL